MRLSLRARAGVSSLTSLAALCSIIFLTSCEEPTAPQSNVDHAPSALSLSQASSDPLAQLGSEMDEMTSWSLLNFPDSRGRPKLVGILSSLQGHLTAGRTDACRDDINDARSFLQSLTENEQVELGGIGVTLDVVEYTLNKS